MVHLARESSPPPAFPSPQPLPNDIIPAPSWTIRLLRTLLIILGLAAWFFTQHLIGARPYTGSIGDSVLDILSPLHAYLFHHLWAQNALLISSSAGIDLLGIFLLARSIFGPTFRPFIGLLILFALRQLMQAICVLPLPPEMIWPSAGPGFPSLLVTYGVGNDLFFSGHTALAVYGAIELARLRRAFIPIGIALAIFEIVAVLALRAHWTMDVYAGALTAILVALLAKKIAPPVDRTLATIFPRP